MTLLLGYTQNTNPLWKSYRSQNYDEVTFVYFTYKITVISDSLYVFLHLTPIKTNDSPSPFFLKENITRRSHCEVMMRL